MEEAWLGELKPYAGEPRGSAGWRLAKAGWRLVRGSRTLLALALLLAALWTASFYLGAVTGVRADVDRHLVAIVAIDAGVLLGTVFLVAAIIAAVDAEIDGFRLGLAEALEESRALAPDLFRWAAISFGVWLAVVLLGRALDAPAVYIVGTWIWYLVAVFALPLLVAGGLPPLASFRESAGLLRRRWRESLAALIGIGFFTALGLLPGGGVISHANARFHETSHSQRALVVLGVFLMSVATALGTATKEGFGLMLVRNDIDDLSPREYGGPRRRRRSKVLRVAVAVVATFALFAAYGAITKHDRRVDRASSAPGENYIVLASNPSGTSVPSGAPVVYRQQVIGEVLGSEEVGASTRVSIHVEPGFTPSSAPGSFVVDPNAGDPQLVLTPAGEASPITPPV